MKNLTSSLFILIFCLSVQAQKVELFTDFDFGGLSHQSLRDFHEELADQIPFNNIKTTDNFKIDYGFTLGMKINAINTSFFYSSAVSGAKSSYADFSGFIRLTNELKGTTFGAIYEKNLQKLGKGELLLGFKGLLTISKLALKTESRLLNVEENSSLNFKSLDFGTGVALTYKYPFKFIILRAYVGFDIYFGGKLKFEEFDDVHLLNDNGNKVTTGWSGLNAGIGVAFPLIN